MLSFFKRKSKDSLDFGSRVYDQVNMFDGGRTYKQRTPTNQRSVIGQASHNGLTNTAGNLFVKPVTNTVAGTVVEPGRSVVAQVTRNRPAMQAAEQRKKQALDQSLPVMAADQAWNIAAIPINLSKQTAADISGNKLASRNANTAVMQNFNRTPVGMVTNIAARNAADYQARRDNPQLTKEQQKEVAARSLEDIGLQRDASLGKQLTDTALGVAGLAGMTYGPQLTASAAKQFRSTPLSPELLAKRNKAVVGYNEAMAQGRPVIANIFSKEIDDIDLSTKAPIVQQFDKRVPRVAADGELPARKVSSKDSVADPLGDIRPIRQFAEQYQPKNANDMSALRSFMAATGQFENMGIKVKGYERIVNNFIKRSGYGNNTPPVKQARKATKPKVDSNTPIITEPRNTTDVPAGHIKVKSPYTGEEIVTLNDPDVLRRLGIDPNQAPQPKAKDSVPLELEQPFYKGFKKDGSSTGSGQGDAFYMSPYRKIAETYDEGVGVKEYRFAKDTKAIDWQSPEYKAIKEKHMKQVPGGEPGYRKPDYEGINKELRAKGYDVVTSKNPDGSMPQVAVLNQSKVIETTQPTKAADPRPRVEPVIDETPTVPTGKTKLRITERLSPDRLIRENVTRPTVEAVNKGIYKASVSDNPIVRGGARLAQGISRELGAPEDLQAARRQFKGTSETGKVVGSDVARLGETLTPESKTRVWSVLDPEQAAKTGRNVDPSTLTPEEATYLNQVKQAAEQTTKGNLERGLITEEQAANPNYLTRAYEQFEGLTDTQVEQTTKQGLLKQYKGRKDVNQELIDQAITNPGYLAGKKTAQSHQAWALVDYANFLDSKGYTHTKGGRGMVQLPDSPLYGSAKGKWVAKNVADDFTGFRYTNSVVNAFNDIISAYDSLGLRQAKKQLLTVFNPAVRLGNQVSNRVFATMNGLNPLEFEKAYMGTRAMVKNRDPIYREAVAQGLTGSDITRADFVKQIADYVDDPKILKEAGNWFQRTYSQADDRARLAAYKVHRAKGYGPDEAARLTQRGFQDYSSVGFFFDMAAKTPLIGNAFVRFAGDALRIGTNALVDHPIRSVGLVSMYGAFNEAMSRFSGESEEDRTTRESRLGAPGVPFTKPINKALFGNDRNISLTTQTPWGEVNVGRFSPFYALNNTGNEATRFLPIQQNPLKPQGWQDPLLGQVGQVLTDTDFRGKSIKDPENVTYDSQGNVKKYPDLPEKDQRNNVLRFLANQNVPLFREGDAIVSAEQGRPDVYGKDRSLPQATLRALGLKVEEFGPEQAEKQRDRNKFFDGNVERVKSFTKNNPDLEQAYYTFNNPTRERGEGGKKVSNLVSPERWKVVSADTSGRLYDFLRKEAETQNKDDGRPIDPVFQLPTKEQINQVLELRSRPTGDDIETEEILRATQPWYTNFEKAERSYYDENSKHFKKLGLPDTQNARVKAYGEIKYPEQSDLIKRYYQIKTANPTQAKDFYKANADALSSAFDSYKQERLKYINAKRKIEGFPPISANAFNNVTFGYEDDERKVYNELAYGKGYGGFSRGNSRKSAGSAYKYAVDINAGGDISAPKISVKGGSKPKAITREASKPKVTLKKSQV